MPIRIVITGPNRPLLDSLHAVLRTEVDMRVVAVADNWNIDENVIGAFKPHVAVLDLDQPRSDSDQTICRLAAGIPTVRLLVTGTHHDRQLVNQLINAGASGYVLGDWAFEELATAIRAVVAGRRYVSPHVATPT